MAIADTLDISIGDKYLSDADVRQSRNRGFSSKEMLTDSQRRCTIVNVCCSNDSFLINTEGARPSWLENAEARMTDLLRLSDNWDNHGAKRPDPRYFVEALSLVLDIIHHDTPAPVFVPTQSGGIQVEWHENGIDFEVEVKSLSEIEVYFFDNDNGIERELTLRHDLTPLNEFVSRLSQGRCAG